MTGLARVSYSGGKVVFCVVLGALPLVLDATGGLGAAWPRGALPAGMSRLALAMLPWFLVYGAPMAAGGAVDGRERRGGGIAGLALGLPLFALAGASDLAAGVGSWGLAGAAAAALGMLALISAARGGPADSCTRPGANDLAWFTWFALMLAPVMLALCIGFVDGGAPLSPEQAPGWLAWSPLGWCLLWAAENPGLEPRLAPAAFGALASAVAIRAAHLVNQGKRSLGTSSREESGDRDSNTGDPGNEESSASGSAQETGGAT